MKLKTCKVCKEKFEPFLPLQVVCSMNCAVKYGPKQAAKKASQEALKQRRELRKAKEKAKRRSDWLQEAQKAFNKFIRLRDANLPCVSCGRTDVEWTVGGAWDCGHYLGVGAYPELRFEELNAHKQCKSCNGGSGKYVKKKKSVDDKYKAELIKRIGIDKVEWLEGPHEPKKYSIDDLKEIKAKYSRLIKEMK